MKANIRVSGFAFVKAQMQNLAHRLPDSARGEMKRAANRIVKRARIYVPEDEGDLMDSIRIEKSYDQSRGGRLVIGVIAGNETVVKAYGRVVDLNQYAALVHEAYETEVAYVNGPGERTLEKMRQHPNAIIGSGFLSRAAEEEQPKLIESLIQITNSIIKGG